MTWNFYFYYYLDDVSQTDPELYEAQITPEEQKIIEAAAAAGQRLSEVTGLQNLISRTEEKVHQMLLSRLCAEGDDYALNCLANSADPFDYGYTLRVCIEEPRGDDDENGNLQLY